MTITKELLSKTEESSVASTSYRTFDTSAIQSAEIPKYSTITNAYFKATVKSSVSLTKASMKIAFSNRSGGSGSPNGTTVKDFGKVIGSSKITEACSLNSFIYSNDASAGHYNGSYPYLLYWSEGSLRTWTLYSFQLQWDIEKPTFSISARALNSTQGEVTGSGIFNVETAAQTKTITAIPKEHYHFVKWNDGDTNSIKTITLDHNQITSHATEVSYEAEFAPNIYTITTSVTGNGTVTGGGDYEFGQEITLKAEPKSGYHFVKWNDGNTDSTRTLTVTNSASYTALFEIDQFFIKDHSEHGHFQDIDNPSYDLTVGHYYDYGTVLRLKPIPDAGYEYSEGNDYIFTFTVTSDYNFEKEFIKIKHDNAGNAEAYINTQKAIPYIQANKANYWVGY